MLETALVGHQTELDGICSVLKALCLGAKGVGLGRVPFYAAACYGEEGITRAFQSTTF